MYSELLARGGASRAAQACFAAAAWGIWCAAQAAQTHRRHLRALSKACHRWYCSAQFGSAESARRLSLLQRKCKRRCGTCQRWQVLSAHAASFAAVLARPCNIGRNDGVPRSLLGRAGCGGHCCCSGRESKLQSAGARRRFASIFACCWALCRVRVRGARPAGQHITAAAMLGGAVVLECCFLRRETLGRETTVAQPLTRHL